jgi:2,5-diketo-D-gluconate reductase A
MPKASTFQLRNGIELPAVGFGTYLIPNDDAKPVLAEALRAGYRHIDTAEGYSNEEGVGAAVRAFIESGSAAREDLFVTTKLWPGNPAWGQSPKTHATTLESIDASLQKLGLDHIDLYLIHGPFAADHRLDQWRALVEAREAGKVRAIGVSNYRESHIEELRDAGLPLPDANQIEVHPWSQKPELVAYLREHSIQPIAYSSLVPLSTWRTAEGQDSAKTEQMRAEGAREDSPFRAMAGKHGVSEAQVLLRWGLQQGCAVIPKSTNPDRMRANLDLFSFELDADDLATIAKMDRGDGVAWSAGDPSRVP